MRLDLHQEVTQRLLADYGFKDKAPWLQQGLCPDCGKKELYTSAEHPWVLRCSRLNRCAWEGHIKEIYPDLFNHWSTRFPSLEQQPQAAADAYLQYARGFDVKRIRGWYTQEHYYDAVLKAGSATVRFAVGETYWERLIDQPERFSKKAHFKSGGRYAGQWWQPPTLDLAQVEALWLVEGIFDAIALHHHGIAAVALLSCNNYPEQALAELASLRPEQRPVLVWALDSDRAGQKYLLKGVARARQTGWTCEAAQIPQPANAKFDWNDCHQRERLNQAALADYRYCGALLLAESPIERARLLYQKNGLGEFVFDYQKQLYSFSLNRNKLERMHAQKGKAKGKERDAVIFEEAAKIIEIANCMPKILYYQADNDADKSCYFFQISQPNGCTTTSTFTGTQIATASEFKKRLLSVAPLALYSGTTRQLHQYFQHQTEWLAWVKTLDFIGYSKEHSCYVFDTVAVKNGCMIEPSEDGCFNLGTLRIKSLNREEKFFISRERQTAHQWLDKLWECFGGKGLVALAFWFGALFAEQIRAHTKSFPYLEIIGEPGAGKSTLIEFLWKLLGRADYEGINPSGSSLSALTRNFARVSNLPIVLLEGDHRDGHSSFALDALKMVYNGRCVRAVSVTNNGLETKEPTFRGALVISQNAPVDAGEAIQERLISLHFDRRLHTEQTRDLAKALETMPLENVSGFILQAITQEKIILNTLVERIPLYEAQLHTHPPIRLLARISKNHALMYALIDALAVVLPLSDEQKQAAQTAALQAAENRQRFLNKEDPVVEEFWDLFEYLERESATPRLNHANDPAYIAINFNDVARAAKEVGQLVPELSRFSEMGRLKARLRTSQRHKFIAVKTVRSAIRVERNHAASLPLTVKCWVFKRNKQTD